MSVLSLSVHSPSYLLAHAKTIYTSTIVTHGFFLAYYTCILLQCPRKSPLLSILLLSGTHVAVPFQHIAPDHRCRSPSALGSIPRFVLYVLSAHRLLCLITVSSSFSSFQYHLSCYLLASVDDMDRLRLWVCNSYSRSARRRLMYDPGCIMLQAALVLHPSLHLYRRSSSNFSSQSFGSQVLSQLQYVRHLSCSFLNTRRNLFTGGVYECRVLLLSIHSMWHLERHPPPRVVLLARAPRPLGHHVDIRM